MKVAGAHALVAAVFGAVELVFGLGHRARDHQLLHRRFSELAARIWRVGEPTEAEMREFEAERKEIEADEPPIYWAVEAASYNEAHEAMGWRGRVKITPWQSLLMHVWPFNSTVFPERQVDQAA